MDHLSKAIFGTTEEDIRYEAPQWFIDGFDNFEEWNAAPEIGEHELPNDYGTEFYEEDEEVSDASPRGQIYREIEEFDRQLCGGRELRDDYDRMEYAATLGVDFSDHTHQHPLRITRYFFRQAVAAALGLKGHPPDMAELGLTEWGAKLADEAKRFRSKNR